MFNEWRCRHNQNYWRYGDYLGIGAAAHQKISLLNSPAPLAAPSALAVPPSVLAVPSSELTLPPSALAAPAGALTVMPSLTWVQGIFRTSNQEVVESYYQQLQSLELPLQAGATSGVSAVAPEAPEALEIPEAREQAPAEEQRQEQRQEQPAQLDKQDRARDEQDEPLAEHNEPLSKQADFLSEQAKLLLEQVAPWALGHEVDSSEIPFEYMLNRLRLYQDPIQAQEYLLYTGKDLKTCKDKLSELDKHGLIKLDQELNFVVTARGKLMLNDAISAFL